LRSENPSEPVVSRIFRIFVSSPQPAMLSGKQKKGNIHEEVNEFKIGTATVI
jgi:hypothetical protein